MIAKTKTSPKQKPKSITSLAEPQVYPYSRWSSLKQKEGDSERRQLEVKDTLVREFAKKAGLPLNETLHLEDEGLSGYHGVHRKKGKLGRFLEMVENGLIASGSYLAVEDIDRLSREEMLDALETILFGLIRNGINIVTFSPYKMVYNRESINNGAIWQLVGQVLRAHGESKRKSELGKANWKQKRKLAFENGTILTGRCPAWLTVKDKKFEVIREAEETIEMIFDLKLKGVGKQTIAKRLNKEAIWTPPKNKRNNGSGLRPSYIQKILQNRAVIGEYQPHKKVNGKREPVGEPIPNYYPRVIDDNTFYAVQELFKKNKGRGGRTGKANNLFTHLGKCAYCGGSMTYVNKGKPPKGTSNLECYNGRMGLGCTPHRIHYDECEKVILENCKGLRADVVLPNPDEQSWRCQLLSKRIQGHIAELRDIEERINNLVTNISDEPNKEIASLLKNKIAELQEQAKETKAKKEIDERELKNTKSSLQSFTKWRKDLASLQKAINKDSNAELRMRLRVHLRELINKIEVFTDGFKDLYNSDKDDGYRAGRITKHGGKTILLKEPGYINKTETIEDELYDVVGEADPKFVRSKLFRDFVKDLTKRRMSKEGRFLRIHFKTGVWIDVVPEGSLASGNELIRVGGKSNWRFVSPDINRLWNEHRTKTG